MNNSFDDTAFTAADVARTARLISPHIVRTPLLHSAAGPWGTAYLKCENLQHTNSFKFRGAISAVLHYQAEGGLLWRRIIRDGVVTCSSGNFGRAVARIADELGFACTVVVPDSMPDVKLQAMLTANPGVQVAKVPYAEWRRIITTSEYPASRSLFLSSETNHRVSLGNATIAAEILRDLSDVDAVLVPYGGGNLAYSIASYLRAAGRRTPVYAVEMTTGAPFAGSLRAGRPTDVEYLPSFVDGIGATFVIPAQFHRVRDLLAGSLLVSPDEVAESVSSLAFHDKIVVEGAGAAAPAAAARYAREYGWKKPCAVVSGGVIEPSLLLDTLRTSRGDAQTTARSTA
ncbi:threonine/serine dehydratase [Streptomyces sp. ODS05-4]|uniref:threonine ammonia-lyase n=1 Tax=Streptomyces sp. ODS05-4 TaxID=2944939 RepID=UPI00210F1829|nr:pyridoxal-phosphate dependent enzyme [Streptomyces sp. ODS05-4]